MENCFPGACTGIVFNGRCWVYSAGHLTYDTMSSKVTEDTIYDVASLTKAVPVSCLALSLIEKGILAQDERVTDVLPEFHGNTRDSVRVMHLLTHTVSFGFRMSTLRHLTGRELLGVIYSTDLEAQPGSVFSYANATSILLGMVIEMKLGLKLDVAADEYFFKPLGMSSTTFHPDLFKDRSIAPTEFDAARGGVICGKVHDESADRFYPGVVGSAGLFSTVNDMCLFIELLLEKGWKERRYFDEATVALMHTNALAGVLAEKTGCGWELDQPFMGMLRSEETFGKTGFTGCSLIIDPRRNVGIVLLSNHIHPHRREDRSIINAVRSEIADLVYNRVDSVV